LREERNHLEMLLRLFDHKADKKKWEERKARKAIRVKPGTLEGVEKRGVVFKRIEDETS